MARGIWTRMTAKRKAAAKAPPRGTAQKRAGRKGAAKKKAAAVPQKKAAPPPRRKAPAPKKRAGGPANDLLQRIERLEAQIAALEAALGERSNGQHPERDPGDAVPPGVAPAAPEPPDAEAQEAEEALNQHLAPHPPEEDPEEDRGADEAERPGSHDDDQDDF